MKNHELYGLVEGIRQNYVYKEGKFQVLIRKDEKFIIEELKLMEEVRKYDEDYKKYEEEVTELLKESALKDENGNPKLLPNRNPNIKEYDIPRDKIEQVKKKREALTKKHQEAVDKQKKKEEEFIKLMNEECDLEFLLIPESRLPSDINGEHLAMIDPLIDWKDIPVRKKKPTKKVK